MPGVFIGIRRGDTFWRPIGCSYPIHLDQATRWLSWYGVGLASADRLPVVVRIPAGPLGSLKCDPPKGNGRRPQKNPIHVDRDFGKRLWVRQCGEAVQQLRLRGPPQWSSTSTALVYLLTKMEHNFQLHSFFCRMQTAC